MQAPCLNIFIIIFCLQPQQPSSCVPCANLTSAQWLHKSKKFNFLLRFDGLKVAIIERSHCIVLSSSSSSLSSSSSASASASSSSSSLLHYLFVFRCYACDDEVPVEPETPVHNCIKLILKAMNLSPPPGLYITDKIDQILKITLNLCKNTYLGNNHLHVIRAVTKKGN